MWIRKQAPNDRGRLTLAPQQTMLGAPSDSASTTGTCDCTAREERMPGSGCCIVHAILASLVHQKRTLHAHDATWSHSFKVIFVTSLQINLSF